jgi:NADH dehydrogenase FAD-containing subunit
MQSGIHAANTIKRRLSGKDAVPFKYRDLGSMATISRFRAVVSLKGLRLSGFPGWLMWLVVHLTFLTGFLAAALGQHLPRRAARRTDDHVPAGDGPRRDRPGRR